MRQRLLLAARSIVLGWVTMLFLAYLIERPLLMLLAGRLGASWFPTVLLFLDGSILAATGYVIGRLHRGNPLLAVAAFAATLTFRDFGDLVEIRVPWLLHLAADTLHDPRYWESLVTTAVTQTFLFGSLAVGGILSRRAPATVLSIVRG